MLSRFHLISITLGAALLLSLLLVAPGPAAADNPPGLNGPSGGRAADALVFLFMHETTSLRANGDGEERVEFLVTNSGFSPVSTAEFLFHVSSTDFWGVEAWDEQGSIDHAIAINGDEIHVTLTFRDPVGLGEQYRYFFAINFAGLATDTGGEWSFNWTTRFLVAEFVRTINLPGGGEPIFIEPAPTSQGAGFVEWVRYVMTEFSLGLRYTLQPLTDDELAKRFAPYFRMHAEDAYVPMNINLALEQNNAKCYPKSGAAGGTCSVGLLGGSWVNLGESYIDFEGDPGGGLTETNSSQYHYVQNIRDAAKAAPVVYARVLPVGSDRTVIQYWLFYYYNSWGKQGGLLGVFGLHEGDWEMVQVVLDGDEQPLYAAYAQHFDIGIPGLKGGSKKEWNDLSRETTQDGEHPVVYPGLGSHASYFQPGEYLFRLDVTAPESQANLDPNPAIYLLDPGSADPWVYYAGKWGQPRNPPFFWEGPSSPGNQGVKWNNPLSWAEQSIDWDEYAGHHLGKVRTHIDAPCNVGVKIVNSGKQFGWIFNEFRDEIDGAEYVVNESINTRSLILHNTYKLAPWEYVLYTTCPAGSTPSARETAEPTTLTVEFYDESINELVAAKFELPADWQPEMTIASLTFADAATLQLEVDDDNDGDTDRVLPPESVVTEPIEEPGETGGGRILVPMVVR